MPGPMSLLRSVEVVVVEEPQRLYRVSRARDDERFAEALRSHYEQGLPPRGPEDRAAVIHMALSMFASADVAAQLAGRVPKLGGHVATIDLVPGLGLCVAKTGSPAHWSAWGRPLQLASCVADVVKVSS
jgi:hypothetical protein